MKTYIKLTTNNRAVPYPISSFKKDYPNVEFTGTPSDEFLHQFGIFVAEIPTPPAHDSRTHSTVQSNFVFNKEQGKWNGVWEIKPLPLEQASRNQRTKRDELIRETDWRFMIDQNPTPEWRDYRQALRDVPQQPGFPYSVEWPVQPGE